MGDASVGERDRNGLKRRATQKKKAWDSSDMMQRFSLGLTGE